MNRKAVQRIKARDIVPGDIVEVAGKEHTFCHTVRLIYAASIWKYSSILYSTTAMYKYTHSHSLCHLVVNMETLLEYLKLDYIRVLSLHVQVPGLLPSVVCLCVCVRFCVSGCGYPSYLRPGLIFHRFPSTFHCFPCTQSDHLDTAGCLSAPQSHNSTLHSYTHNSLAVNSPVCGERCLKIVLLSL